jgi:drug/metabolite transporter (DMT)-like permease
MIKGRDNWFMHGPGASPAKVWAALGVVYVVWGSTYLFILLAIDTIPVFLSMGIRFVLAGGLLYLWAIRRGDVAGDRIGRRQWIAAAVVGGLLFVGGNSLVSWSETRVDTGVAALLIAAVPLWMALFDRAANGQRLSRPVLLGLLLGFGGVALLAWPSGPSRIDALGAFALLVSGAAWAAGSLVARRVSLPRRPLVSSGMQMFAGGMLLMLVATASGELTEVGRPSLTSVLAMLYLIVIGSWLAFSAYSWLLQVAPTSIVSTYAYVNPVVAVFLGWAFLSEPLSARTVVAGAVILGAVALIVTPSQARPRPMPAAAPVRAR